MNIWWGNIVQCYTINAHKYFEVWNNFFSFCFRFTRIQRKKRPHGMCGQGERARYYGSDLWPDAKRLFVLQFSTENTEIRSIKTIPLPAIQFKASSDFWLRGFEIKWHSLLGISCQPEAQQRIWRRTNGMRWECCYSFSCDVYFIRRALSSWHTDGKWHPQCCILSLESIIHPPGWRRNKRMCSPLRRRDNKISYEETIP